MKNKIYQKVLKQVVIFVAALVLLSPGILFAQERHIIELEDYGIHVYDVSDEWCEVLEDVGTYFGYTLGLCTTRSMDEKGKITGTEELWIVKEFLNSGDDWDFYDDGWYFIEELLSLDLKGTAKRGGSGNLKVKTVAKGKGSVDAYQVSVMNMVKKELIEGDMDEGEPHTWQGVQKFKGCAKGEGCDKFDIVISDDEWMDGEYGITVEAVTGKKSNPDAFLLEDWELYDCFWADYYIEYYCDLYFNASSCDYYNDYADDVCEDGEALAAKGKTSDKKAETKVSLKGGKGIKINLTIDEKIVEANDENDIDDEDDDICTSIKGKIYGQKISYK